MIDLSQIGIGALTQIFTDIMKDILKGSRALARGELEKLAIDYKIGFTQYLERNYARCSKMKTLLHRYQPINLRDAYVSAQIQFGDATLDADGFFSFLSRHRTLIVSGAAGSGKSVFLKIMFMNMCEKQTGRIPLFIELRRLNTNEGVSLLQHILDELVPLIPHITMSQLRYAMSSGKIALLLDGLDEVSHRRRDLHGNEVLTLSYTFPELLIVVSSRPDERFVSWHEFHLGTIMPLKMNQIIQLVEKMDFDTAITDRFIARIKSDLYSSHREFLSNALLCTMMLMTFEQFADVPTKMHIFYAQAFDVLYTKHDATKPSFHRDFYCALPMDDFRRIYSTFCLLSYLDKKFSLTESQAITFAEMAIRFEDKKEINASDFVRDLDESVSLLLKDGNFYSFLHRSFQEYFVAIFFVDRPIDGIESVIHNVVINNQGDSVIEMIIEINQEAFEDKYYRARLSSLRDQIDRLTTAHNPREIIKLFYSDIKIYDDSTETYVPFPEGELRAPYALFDIARCNYSLSKKYWNQQPLRSSSTFAWEPVLRKYKIGRNKENTDPPGEITIPVSKLSNELINETPIGKHLDRIRQTIRITDDEVRKNTKGKASFISQLLRNPEAMGGRQSKRKQDPNNV